MGTVDVLGAPDDGVLICAEGTALCASTTSTGAFRIDEVPAGLSFKLLAVLNGFTVKGQTPRRRWTLNAAECTRTGIERFDLDEDPNKSGALFLRDVRCEAGTGSFASVKVEIVIGTGATADKLNGTAALMQQPDGSGKWRLIKEP